MTGKDDDAASLREDAYLSGLVPQVAERLAEQHAGNFDAQAGLKRFQTWLEAHTEQPGEATANVEETEKVSLAVGGATLGVRTVETGQAPLPAATDEPESPGKARPQPASTRSKRSARRQAHLTIARIDPWSVMKVSFVVSLVGFVVLFVAVSALYGTLTGLGVFDSLQRAVSSVTSSQGSAGVNAKAWFSMSRVLGYTAMLGSLNIVLITGMSTIGAMVYNLASRLVGGVQVTLRERE